MRGFYNSQLEAKGDITEEFIQFCLRQIAPSILSRTGMDLARIWQELAKSKYAFQPEKDSKVLVARRCISFNNPTFSSTLYTTQITSNTIICLNDHFLCSSDTSKLSFWDISTGNYVEYDIPNVKFITPIKTGGFIFATYDGSVISTIRDFNKFSPVLSAKFAIGELKASRGLHTTFAMVDVTRKVLIYCTPDSIQYTVFDNEIVDFDIFNQKVFVATNSPETQKGKITLFDCVTPVHDWESDLPIKKIKWLPEIKNLGIITTKTFAVVDPRVTCISIVYDDIIFDFSYSPINRYLCLFKKESVEIIDDKTGFSKATYSLRSSKSVEYKAEWLKNDDLLSIFTSNGSYILLSPEIMSPVLENIAIEPCQPLSLQTSYSVAMLITEDKAIFISTDPSRLFVPQSL